MVDFLNKDFKLALENKKSIIEAKLINSQLNKLTDEIVNKLGKVGDIINTIEDIDGFIKQNRIVKEPVSKMIINKKIKNNVLIINIELYSKDIDNENYSLINDKELINYGVNKKEIFSELEDLVKMLPDINDVEVYVNNNKLLNMQIKTEVDLKPIINEFKDEINEKLPLISDLFLKEIKSSLAKKKLTSEQEERYRVKYEAAIKAKETDDYRLFELEAKLVGMKPEDLVDLIITTGNNWRAKITELSIIIDGVRVALARKVKEIDDVEELNIIPKIVDELKSLGLNITVDEALRIIERYLG